MAPLSEELQTVLKEAERAQQLEDDLELNAASDIYYAAACQLSYLIDLHVDKDSALEQICWYLVNFYQQRLTALRAKLAAAEESHWIQLEQGAAATGQLVFTSSRTSFTAARAQAASTAPTGPACASHDQHTTLQTAIVAAGAGAMRGQFTPVSTTGADSEGGDATQMSCHSDPQAAIELLRMCQRAVSGTLDDVIGLEEVKEEIEEAIFLPMQHPYLFKGIRQPARTFLLYGPPGTGKTMLVEKVAAEADLNLLAVSPSMILSRWSGESEKAISQVFELARTMQPALLFMDEIDSIGQSRDSNTDPGSRRLLTELLIQFNRTAEEGDICIFAATNRMQDCDPALLRRFSRRIEVPLPTEAERQAFIQSVLLRPGVGAAISQDEMQQLAQQTHGYSGSDLVAVCRLAAMAPVRELCHKQRQQCSGIKRRRLGVMQSETVGCGGLQITQQATQLINGSLHHVEAKRTQPITNNTEQQRVSQQPLAAEEEQKVVADLSPQVAAGFTCQEQQHAAVSVKGETNKGQLQVRELVYADFCAALQKIKPAAADAQAAPQY